MYSITLTALLLCCCQMVFAQSVVTTSGGNFSNNGTQMSWTLGEPVIGTFEKDGIIINQGLQQGEIVITALFEPEITLDVFPNPTTRTIWVKQGEHTPGLSIQLIDMTGNQVIPTTPLKDQNELPVQHLSYGAYLLQVINTQGKILNSYKIIKR